MVSERAKEANYFGKYDTPYKKRKDVPQNSTGKNAVKTKPNKPESRGAKPQNAPAQKQKQKQKLPDKGPIPQPRPDLAPIFEPGGSMAPPIYEPGGGAMPPPAPIFEPGGSTMPPPFAPGGSQLAMPATGNTIPSPPPLAMPATGNTIPSGPAPVLPQLQNLPSTGMTQLQMPSMEGSLTYDPRIAALLQRGGASGPSPLNNGPPVVGGGGQPLVGGAADPLVGKGRPVIPWFGS